MKVTKLDVELWADAIIAVHDMIIDKIDGPTGQKGVRDMGGLEHAIFSIMSIDNKYGRPIYVAAKTYQMLATRHYFFDGNKRTSHITAKVFLSVFGGLHLKVHYKEAAEFIVAIANGKKIMKEIEDWIESNSEKGIVYDLESELKEMKDYTKDN